MTLGRLDHVGMATPLILPGTGRWQPKADGGAG